MGKVKSDFNSYLHGSPSTPESEQFLHTLKSYSDTAFGKNQQTIKINFLKLYVESINRIKQQHISEEQKQNQIKRLEEIKEYAEQWEKAQKIFLFFYERQLDQNEVFKRALLNYLELMAKQELLAQAMFLVNLIKFLDSELFKIEEKIKVLEKESQEIHTRLVNTVTQLFMDSLPEEIKNSSQKDEIRRRYAEHYSAALIEQKKSNILDVESNQMIVSKASQTILRDFISNEEASSASHKLFIEKTKSNQDVHKYINNSQEKFENIRQLKVDRQTRMNERSSALQQLSGLPSEIRSILAEQIPVPEQPKQDASLSQRNHTNSTASILGNAKLNLKQNTNLQPQPPPQPQPPLGPDLDLESQVASDLFADESSADQQNITENNSNVEKSKDNEPEQPKKPKEDPDEPLPSFGLKPR